MKKYKVLSSNAVFRIAGKEYITKEGDVIELPEEHVTTRALLERGRLEEYQEVAPTETDTTTTPEVNVTDVTTVKKSKK